MTNCEEFLLGVADTLTGANCALGIDEDEFGAIITLFADGNISALIGNRGATIEAIRTIAKALGYNGKHRIKLVLHESI